LKKGCGLSPPPAVPEVTLSVIVNLVLPVVGVVNWVQKKNTPGEAETMFVPELLALYEIGPCGVEFAAPLWKAWHVVCVGKK
jgi:hypothetical protein